MKNKFFLIAIIFIFWFNELNEPMAREKSENVLSSSLFLIASIIKEKNIEESCFDWKETKNFLLN